MQIEEASMRIRMMNDEERIWFFFSIRTAVMTLKESYVALILKRWKILTTRSIRKTTKPDRKKNGRIVRSSMIPSKDHRNRHTASFFDLLG